MVKYLIDYTISFKKQFSKIKDNKFKQKIIKQIEKIVENPLIGKPMKNIRKGTRELYIRPYRLAYQFKESELLILFVEIYYKDKQ